MVFRWLCYHSSPIGWAKLRVPSMRVPGIPAFTVRSWLSVFFDKIGWHPSIGDPSIFGWAIVAMYFLTAALAVRVSFIGGRVFDVPVSRQKYLWLAVAALMFLLGINKQLDLQSFFTASLKYLFIKYDWYADRRAFQVGFIYTIAVLGLVVMSCLIGFYYRVIKQHMLAIFGMCFIVAFVVIRASSFHHVDALLGVKIGSLNINRILEFMGICFITLNALWFMWRAKVK